MKRVLCCMLAVLLLCGCAPKPTPPEAASTDIPATEATEPTMSEAEARAILQARRDMVEAEMRRMMSVMWCSDTDISYTYRKIPAGQIYCGIPYSHGSGSTDAYLDCGVVDENGVYHITGLNNSKLQGTSSGSISNCARLGNDCTDAVFWAWARVSSTIDFDDPRFVTEKFGCLKVGQYTCDDRAYYKNTIETVKANGEQTMFQAYMQLQKGDGLASFNGETGHTLMFVDIHVEYTADGLIDAENSYCLIHEQGGGGDQDGKKYFDEKLGQEVIRIGGTDNKYTFRKLFDRGFLPVTIKELVDPSPLPEAVVADSLTEHSFENLYSGQISSNYRISHVTVQISGEAGQVYHTATCYAREEERFCFQMKNFRTDGMLKVLKGELPAAMPAGNYTCTVTCHISTGEDIVVRQFDFQK